MLPTDGLSALQAYALNRDPLPSGSTPQAGSLVPLSELLNVGQVVQGSVVAQVAPNLYTVKIAGQVVQMPLPGSMTAGTSLALRVVSLSPQLAFAVNQPNVGGQPAQSATAQLGATAQWIADLAQGPVTGGGVTPPPLLPTSPTAPIDAVQLAQTLQQSLATSGLFYEAHQAQWVNGQQSTAHLRLQPQNQPPPTSTSANNPLPGSTLMSSVADATALTSQLSAPAQGNPTAFAPAQSMFPSASLSGALPAPLGLTGQGVSPVPSHLQSLVQQQLAILESGRIVWNGPLMPDQSLHWQLWPEGSPTQPSVTAAWHTELQLELPTLGAVTAKVTLDHQGVRLRLSAQQPAAQQTMIQQRASLVEALGQAGIPVLSADVVPGATSAGAP